MSRFFAASGCVCAIWVAFSGAASAQDFYGWSQIGKGKAAELYWSTKRSNLLPGNLEVSLVTLTKYSEPRSFRAGGKEITYYGKIVQTNVKCHSWNYRDLGIQVIVTPDVFSKEAKSLQIDPSKVEGSGTFDSQDPQHRVLMKLCKAN